MGYLENIHTDVYFDEIGKIVFLGQKIKRSYKSNSNIKNLMIISYSSCLELLLQSMIYLLQSGKRVPYESFLKRSFKNGNSIKDFDCDVESPILSMMINPLSRTKLLIPKPQERPSYYPHFAMHEKSSGKLVYPSLERYFAEECLLYKEDKKIFLVLNTQKSSELLNDLTEKMIKSDKLREKLITAYSKFPFNLYHYTAKKIM